MAEQDASEQRREEVERKMKEREEARLLDKEKRRAALDEQAAPDENIHNFFVEFSSQKEAISSALEKEAKPTTAWVEAETKRVNELQEKLNRATHFLPPYDIRQSQAAIGSLTEKLSNIKASLKPRKKFSFQNRNKLKSSAPADQSASAAAPQTDDSAAEKPKKKEDDENTKRVSDKQGQTFINGGFDSVSGFDLVLSNLQDCTLWFTQPVSAVFVDKLVGCKIYLGPCAGSIHIEECKDCEFYIACHQFRLHTTTNSKFSLLVRSKPIIEKCNGLHFSPYSYIYEGQQKQMEAENLNLRPEQNRWDQVDDFNWLRQQQSPNWSVLPEAERQVVEYKP